ncbi:MAG: response regulator [Flavobacteriaceae bacterium]|nr:response regulator [Flavobacteriaceae bacterium]
MEHTRTKVLIVEDEAIIAVSIKSYLQSEGFDVVGMVSNAQAALEILNKCNIDLAILDINIQGDKNGIWLGNYLFENYAIPYIYLTAYSNPETLTEAKITEPAAYLVKPFNKSNLFASIQMALYKNQSEEEKLKQKMLQEQADNLSFVIEKNYLFAKIEGMYRKIFFQEIYYLSAEKNYVGIHLETEKFMMRSTMKDTMEKLPSSFLQTHRSFVVNTQKIHHVSRAEIHLGRHIVPLVKVYRDSLINSLDAIQKG